MQTGGSIAWATAAASGGTVTSVSWTGDGTIFTASADTAVTTSGTLTPASLIAQTKNTFLGGPSTGSNAAPTFRAIATADLPNPLSSPGSGTGSEQFGASASVGSANYAVALGYSATAAAGAVSIGYSANGIGTYGVQIGYTAAAKNSSVSIGTTASDTSSGNTVVIGGGAKSAGNSSVAVGSSTNIASGHYWSIALGASATTTAAYQLMIGNSAAYVNSAVICGNTGGSTLNLAGNSSTTTSRFCGIISSSFNTSTDASWSGNLSLYAGDHTSSNAGKQLGVQIQSDGTQALVGFYGQHRWLSLLPVLVAQRWVEAADLL